MKENWYALFICLYTNMSVDKALRKMNVCFKGASRPVNKNIRCKYSDEFIDKIFSLKALGKTHKQIGLIVGLTAYQVSGIVRWHKEKAIQDPTKVSCIAMRKNSTSLYHRIEVSQ